MWSNNTKENPYIKPYMNDLTSIKDYLIADEIQRIKLLTKEELVRELVEVKTSKIETFSEEELLDQLPKQNS